MFYSFVVGLLILILVPFLSVISSAEDTSGYVAPYYLDKDVTELYGTYVIVDVARYRGGFTTRQEAEATIGQEVVVSYQAYRFLHFTVETPSYKVHCYPDQPEGHVTPRHERWSNFYGFGTDRDGIEILEVYDSDDDLWSYFEVISADELWKPYDGWLYMMRRAPVQGECGSSRNTCTAGTYNLDPPDAGDLIRWTCEGLNGGQDASCSETLNPPGVGP